tara:strand:+ start:1154 stop:1366 length:213 start_codon:yes stop_codon:yes gene_type:complete
MVLTDSFIALQKTAILNVIEMNNDNLIRFIDKKLYSSSFIDLQKEAIKKIYKMDSKSLHKFLDYKINDYD